MHNFLDNVKELFQNEFARHREGGQGARLGGRQDEEGAPGFVPPDPTKEIVIGSGTPSDWRARRNLLAQLKRQGFIWPWPPQKGKEKK